MMRSLTFPLVLLALAGCATPAVQAPLTPPAGFAGPQIETLRGGADALIMADGARLPLTRWTPTSGEAPWAVIVGLHGVNDSRASFRLAGPWWAERGIETWAYDQRGFGGAPGKGIWPGEALMVSDLRTAVALARAAHPGAVIAVAGESMGGSVTIAAFASDDPPDADRAILLAPAVWGWSSQAPINRLSLWTTAHLMGDRTIRPPDWLARARAPTDNWVEWVRNGRDPASIREPRFDSLYGLVEIMEAASQGLGRVRAPTLLLYGAHDHLIEDRPMRRTLERAGPRPGLVTGFYPEGWHILNRDLQAEVMFADVESWLRDPARPLPSGAEPVEDVLRR